MAGSRLWLVPLLGLVLASQGFEVLGSDADEVVVVVRMKRGGVHKGYVLSESEREIVLRTWVGDKSLAKDEVAEIQRNLSAAERMAILRSASPMADEKAFQERERAVARGEREGGGERPSSGLAKRPTQEKPAAAQPAQTAEHLQREPARFVVTGGGSWEERLSAALDKRISLELNNDRLEEALELVRSIANVNIIVSPKVAEANPTLSLKVSDMDVGAVLHWLTKLTHTFIEVRDQALFVTDQPSKEAEDAERNEVALMMTRSGVDLALLPAAGTPLSDADLFKIASAIWEKTEPKLQDFPGPHIELGAQDDRAQVNPFAQGPGN